jgi:4-carboxymuconolactone decarboxylase
VEKEGFMATLDERFQQGLEMRARLAGGEGRIFKGPLPIAYELAPDMYRITTESLYGSIWSRPGLELKYRVMATLTVAAIQLTTPQVRAQVRNALNVGITPEEIIEICMMVAFYGGIPAAYGALAVTKEVFEERGMQVTLPETFDPTVAPDALYERGIAKHQELMPDVFGYHPTEPTEVEHELDVLMQEYLWGAIWTRPGLDMKSRIVCALASRVVKGQFDLSVRRMIEGALRYGLTKVEIMEIGMQLVFYVGALSARAFMHIANTVFRSPEFSQTDDPGL